MMGSTLLSVDAAELGDRALLDSLLPHSYPAAAAGALPDAVGDARKNDAVNFVTGAGGFLQQVIFGYTGLRIGREGTGAGVRPGAAVHVKRLTCATCTPGPALRRDRGFDRPPDHPARRVGSAR